MENRGRMLHLLLQVKKKPKVDALKQYIAKSVGIHQQYFKVLILLFGPLVIISSLIVLNVSFFFVICFVIYSSNATCVYHDYSMQYEPTQT